MSDDEPRNPEEHTEGPARIDFGRWIAEGWLLIRDDLAGYVIASIIICSITVAAVMTLNVVGLIVLGPAQAGFYLMVTNHMRTGRPLIGDMFHALSKFVPVMLATILLGLLISCGLVLCLVPGLFALGIWMFTYLFIVDKGLDFWEAMEASRMLAKEDYLEFGLFALVVIVLNMAGFLALIIGMLVTIPLSFAAITCAYRDLVGLADEPAVKSPTPPEMGA
jgi:uncharacterized membrane protein